MAEFRHPRRRLGDLLEPIALAVQHHDLDLAPVLAACQHVVDELLVVRDRGIDEHHLVTRGRDLVDQQAIPVLLRLRVEDDLGLQVTPVLIEHREYVGVAEPGDAIQEIATSLGHVAAVENEVAVLDCGFDLSDISFVRGRSGWIVIDPLVSAEVARAAVELFQKHVGKGEPITTVIYSHSHGDHWGGVRGVVDEADVRSGDVEIIAPRDFMQHTISENVYAGNAMNRRLFYQYGILLPASPYGHAGQGLGQNVSNGSIGLIPPTRIIEEDIEYLTVDGVSMVFQNTPNTEAPSEMNTYFPEMKVLWMAENVTSTLHNIYTLRGAPVRDALRWSKYINEALYLFGLEAEVLFASHHWPRWGNERVQEILRGQRDLYANMNNQSLHYANQGVTINQIHNVYELPKSRCPAASSKLIVIGTTSQDRARITERQSRPSLAAGSAASGQKSETRNSKSSRTDCLLLEYAVSTSIAFWPACRPPSLSSTIRRSSWPLRFRLATRRCFAS